MWKVFWISAGCRNQAACCLVACIVRTKALLSNLIILEILTINAGFWGLFCCCSFFFLKALSPGAVALLRITVFLLKKKSEKLRTLVSTGSFGKKKLHKGEPGCVANVPSRHAAFRHVIFASWHYFLPRECDERGSRARFSHGIKAQLQKTQAFRVISCEYWAGLMQSRCLCPQGSCWPLPVFFHRGLCLVLWSGDKQ